MAMIIQQHNHDHNHDRNHEDDSRNNCRKVGNGSTNNTNTNASTSTRIRTNTNTRDRNRNRSNCKIIYSKRTTITSAQILMLLCLLSSMSSIVLPSSAFMTTFPTNTPLSRSTVIGTNANGNSNSNVHVNAKINTSISTRGISGTATVARGVSGYIWRSLSMSASTTCYSHIKNELFGTAMTIERPSSSSSSSSTTRRYLFSSSNNNSYGHSNYYNQRQNNNRIRNGQTTRTPSLLLSPHRSSPTSLSLSSSNDIDFDFDSNTSTNVNTNVSTNTNTNSDGSNGGNNNIGTNDNHLQHDIPRIRSAFSKGSGGSASVSTSVSTSATTNVNTATATAIKVDQTTERQTKHHLNKNRTQKQFNRQSRNSHRNQHHSQNNNNINNNNNHNNNSSKKNRVKTMFRQAKEMERTGQWRQACVHLKKILEIDPYDSYSHLALGRLQSRRERGGSGNGVNNHNNNDNHYGRDGTSTNNGGTGDGGGGVTMLSVDNGTGGTFKSSTIAQQQRQQRHDNEDMSTSSSSSIHPRTSDDTDNKDTHDIITTTPLKILQSEPHSEARQAFYHGTQNCPDSIHLWQAWALHEQSKGNIGHARNLFSKALSLDDTNPYVCHGYGQLEHRVGNFDVAMELWERPLKTGLSRKTSAALVCSLGKLLVAKGELHKARDLYLRHVLNIKSERQACEVYLAAAWLEEKHFLNIDRAEELLNLALRVSPNNSRAFVALARLAGRRVDLEKQPNNNVADDVVGRRRTAVKKRLKDTCNKMIKGKVGAHKHKGKKSDVLDGRLFNAWADMEVKEKRYGSARRILIEGRKLFPKDHSLFQSAGKVEERVGNFTGARDLYSESLLLSPSAPTLVAYALLELQHPVEKSCNYTKVARLFEEALLLDPRHGPVYNAYGNMELKRGNVERARQIYQNGVFAHCRDIASVYHGLAMLELSLGNVETARLVLIKGLKEVKINDGMMDNNRRKRSQFLTHTLGMLELNSNRAIEAKIVFESGLERHVNSSQLLLGAALSEVKLGNEDAARVLFERSVTVDRKHAQAWQSWGVMEMRAGNYKVAKTLFECGLKNDPKHGALWQAYATMESRLGNFDTARALYAAGVTKCPNHVPMYQAWACLEIRGENYEKAKTLISEALTRDKSEGSGWLVAAKIEEKLGNEGLMIMILRRGLECAPNSAELYCAVADYEVRRGKIDLARNLLEKGLEVDPLHAPLYHSLAELEARVFNVQGLAELNKRAAEIFHTNALESPPLSMNLLGTKLRKSALSKKKIPNNITALVKKTDSTSVAVDSSEKDHEDHVDRVLNVETTIMGLDPDRIIKNMNQLEDDVVTDLFLENVDISEDGNR